jgi:hypothetical protein
MLRSRVRMANIGGAHVMPGTSRRSAVITGLREGWGVRPVAATGAMVGCTEAVGVNTMLGCDWTVQAVAIAVRVAARAVKTTAMI